MADDVAGSVLLAIANDATLPATARLLAAAALAGAGRAGVAPTVIEHDPDAGCSGCRLSCDEMGAECRGAGRDLPRSFYAAPEEPAPDWCPLRAGGVLVRSPRG